MFKFINNIAAFLDKLTEPVSDAQRLGDPPGTIYTPMTPLEVQYLMNTGVMENEAHLQHMARTGQIDLQETMANGEAALAETMYQLEIEQHNNSTWAGGGIGGGF